ncbi:MAG: PQQ-binding-like beta-propeller repeat protein [Nitrososphaerota archaeon]|nr:PQQ-binding-like beta-propeller repeat protein [Nitrososphaerota archaeon]
MISNNFKLKNVFSILTVILMLSFVTSMFALPNANAQNTTKQIVTFPFVDSIPHKAGIGQPVLINWGLLNYLYWVDDGWNVTLQITNPNGKVENVSGKTWSTGTIGRRFTFTDPGNYTLQCIFDGELYLPGTNGSNGGYYQASTSKTSTFEIIEGYWKDDYPGHSHPTEYWTRPVDSQLREWYSIMGSWLLSTRNAAAHAPYNEGPESAHVLWSKPIGDTLGGLSGGANGAAGFQNGDAYEGKFLNSVIVAGVLYYNREAAPSSFGNVPRSLQMIIAVDLHTGKTLWERNCDFGTGRIERASILTFATENNRGAFAYLWIVQGTNMWALEPATGELRYNMTNVPTGTIYYGPSGEMLKYAVTNIGTTENPNWRLTQWNSTHVVLNSVSGAAMSDAWGSQVHSASNGTVRSFDATRGYDVNVSISGLTTNPGTQLVAFIEDRLIYSTTPGKTGMTLTGISLNPENIGYLLFSRPFTAPAVWEDFFDGETQNGFQCYSNDPYIAIFWTKNDRINYAFSLETGRLLWQTKESRIYADAWQNPVSIIAYGRYYSSSVGGILYCYNATTGDLLWTYDVTDKYNESYHGENWWIRTQFVADGKLYLAHSTHSNQIPIARGAPYLCIDAYTGNVVWEIDGAFRSSHWGGGSMIGDSIIVAPDVYDQKIYAIGKGPSELTVSVYNGIATVGQPIKITGTVMDVSPGTEQDRLRYQFSNGVPAMSDESQSEWMLYVYKGFEQPMAAKGIEITLYAHDGESKYEIGKTTSDARGIYSINWSPQKEGDYEIWAYFDGTAAFYGDDAKTDISVFAAPVVVEPEPTPPYEWYIVGIGIAVIAVVIICTILILRKK